MTKMPPKFFKVMWPPSPQNKQEYQELGCPKTVPWDFVAPHEKQARENHHQTLETLHSRGGLDAVELIAVLEGKSWPNVDKDVTRAIRKLGLHLFRWYKENEP